MTSKRPLRGCNVFNDKWKDDPAFSEWLKPTANRAYAGCKVCGTNDISLSSLGRAALTSHAKGKKHQNRMESGKSSNTINDLFSCQTSESSSSTSVQSNAHVGKPSSEPTLDGFVRKDETSKSEVVMTLLGVKTHMSANSIDYWAKNISGVCPDSDIASKISMGRTKFSYTLCHGISPFLREKQEEVMKSVPEYVAMFDESLNTVSQKSQMDIHVRFYDSIENKVVTQFYDSVFLGHTKASDLLKGFCEKLEGIDQLRHLIAVSMDGPSVNWKFLTDLEIKRRLQNFPELLQVGSCGLHIVHRSFECGHSSSSFEVNVILKAAYNLFKDSPARRSDFIEITGSDDFPKRFCAVRWCENSSVVKRFLSSIDNLQKYCKEVEPKPKVKCFEKLENALKCPLTRPKLHFFQFIAWLVEPFLTRFQADQPLLPFLYDELLDVMKSVARRYLPKENIAQTSGTKLIELMTNASVDNCDQTDFGVATTSELQRLKPREVLEFRTNGRKFLVEMGKKMAIRSPLQYPVVQKARSLSPIVILNNAEDAVRLFSDLVLHLVQKSLCEADQGDLAIQQWEKLLEDKYFISSTVSAFREKSKAEWPRLDTFYWKHVGSKSEYSQLWLFIRKILTLPHGNATVEKGFSIQKNQLCENFLEESMIARRRIFDFVGDTEMISELVSPKMVRAMKGSNARYRAALEERSRKRHQMENSKAEEVKAAKLRLIEIAETERRLNEERKALAQEKTVIQRTLQK